MALEPGDGVTASRRQLDALGARVIGQAGHEAPGCADAAQLVLGLHMQDGAAVALDRIVGPDPAGSAVRIGEALLEALFVGDVAEVGQVGSR